jgi:hypothetical protein
MVLFDNSTLVSHSNESRPCHLPCIVMILPLQHAPDPAQTPSEQGTLGFSRQFFKFTYLVLTTQARQTISSLMRITTSIQARKICLRVVHT